MFLPPNYPFILKLSSILQSIFHLSSIIYLLPIYIYYLSTYIYLLVYLPMIHLSCIYIAHYYNLAMSLFCLVHAFTYSICSVFYGILIYSKYHCFQQKFFFFKSLSKAFIIYLSLHSWVYESAFPQCKKIHDNHLKSRTNLFWLPVQQTSFFQTVSCSRGSMEIIGNGARHPVEKALQPIIVRDKGGKKTGQIFLYPLSKACPQ